MLRAVMTSGYRHSPARAAEAPPEKRNRRSARTPSESTPRIQDPGRVERVLDGAVHVHRVLAELEGEPPPLDEADAILAGQGAAHVQRGAEHLVRGRPDGGRDVALRHAPVEDEDRVQVAVAGVRDGGDHD